MNSRIKAHLTIASGNWLKLEKLTYSDHNGDNRDWETVTRIHSCGVAAVIAILKPSNRIILIRQFRPPAEGYVIEFPAGLIDNGEDAEATAKRELTEETGYTGKVIEASAPSYSSPGLSGETVNMVFMEVDETAPCNHKLETNFDDGEYVETLLVELADIESFLATRAESGDLMDAKVITFAKSLQMQKKMT